MNEFVVAMKSRPNEFAKYSVTLTYILRTILTSDSKKPGQTAVLWFVQVFLNQTLFDCNKPFTTSHGILKKYENLNKYESFLEPTEI